MAIQALPAARQFLSPTARPRLEPLGRGLINDTYRVIEGNTSWILQRINCQVFPDPPAIMANLRRVTEHARQARKGCPETRLRLPELIPTRDGADFYEDAAGDCWRAMTYIEETRGLPAIAELGQAEQVGRALGWFHRLMSELPAEDLHDTLPGFHVTPGYLAAFDATLAQCAGPVGTPELDEALAFVDSRRKGAAVLETAKTEGRLVLRVIHGDPKLDNVLFDRRTGEAVSLIDLDTVKPGLIHYDLGDCARSCCNRARECSPPGAACFDLDLFRALLRGYGREADACLTPGDREYLYDAVRLLPFELGLRFLNDHLAGDVYFKVSEPGQNLRRALGQFHLARSIESREQEIREALVAVP